MLLALWRRHQTEIGDLPVADSRVTGIVFATSVPLRDAARHATRARVSAASGSCSARLAGVLGDPRQTRARDKARGRKNDGRPALAIRRQAQVRRAGCKRAIDSKWLWGSPGRQPRARRRIQDSARSFSCCSRSSKRRGGKKPTPPQEPTGLGTILHATLQLSERSPRTDLALRGHRPWADERPLTRPPTAPSGRWPTSASS
jgi:hypothetical protein